MAASLFSFCRFTKDLPREPLDGELWCGRGLFQKTLSIIKVSNAPHWRKRRDAGVFGPWN